MSALIANNVGPTTLRSLAGDGVVHPLLLAQAAVGDTATSYDEEPPRTPTKRQNDNDGQATGSNGKRIKKDVTPTDPEPDKKSTHEPEVWSMTRMALCETLPEWYRSYNSSLYMQDLVARGLYIDSGAHDHDIFQAQVIVCSM